MSDLRPSTTISIDGDDRALYVAFNDRDVAETVELAPNVFLDVDSDYEVVGVEILHASPDLLALVGSTTSPITVKALLSLFD